MKVAKEIENLIPIFENYPEVKLVYLFGSMATGLYIHNRSDYDFGVIIKNPKMLKENKMEIYNQLYDIITSVLPKGYLKKRMELRAHEFDVVFLQEAPISLQAKIIQEGKALYQSDVELLNNYREYVLEQYCDLQYVYHISHANLLERL